MSDSQYRYRVRKNRATGKWLIDRALRAYGNWQAWREEDCQQCCLREIWNYERES